MKPAPSIAIVGMACVYPDARTPAELWENVLAQRRAFRRLPPERLRAEDYVSADPAAPDCTYCGQAAVIQGYEFDRVAFRVVGSTFRSADLAHWLALDVAAKALADAGFAEGRGLPRESTGVLLGNTLTGEFSRANVMRLRWPYVRRVLEAALAKEGWEPQTRDGFLKNLENEYKGSFAPMGEETLAGGLSNTIAGRICNQFDLKGGGYTVDGACASSLLAVANACSGLAVGDLDVALAGGVDLSLDPFELVGFAKTGALAREEMRVFDRRSAGFWPGEGCGIVVLMRHEDALAQGCRVYASIRGWGISSDGSGGITRPEAAGQLEAVSRAYRRAGFGIDTVAYCEGHGTGTAVGDATELEVLTRARREANPKAPIAVVGSIKANIGHTKAAAGIAGLLKATMSVHTQVLPPTTGCTQPHQHLDAPDARLKVLPEAELWPMDRPLRASVSAMGFGGINAHLVLESTVSERRHALSSRERSLSASHQDAELFLLGAPTRGELLEQVERLLSLAVSLSRAELTDLAAGLQKLLVPGSLIRAAIVASKPVELAQRSAQLKSWLQTDSAAGSFQFSDGLFLASGADAPRIAFLFPGQGSPTHVDGGIWRRRFETVRELYAQAALPQADSISTRVMQPAVVTASLAGLKILQRFGVVAEAGIGHSLGEFTALHWAGALSEEALLRVAEVRGAAMEELGSHTGAMLAIAAPASKVQPLLEASLHIVGFNSPRQTVVAGEAAAIKRLAQRAEAAGHHSSRLPVSHAFHTPLVGRAVPVLADQLAREDFARLERRVFSTVTGRLLDDSTDLRALLCRQVTSPVRFSSALGTMLAVETSILSRSRLPTPAPAPIDLFIEVGPGSVLSGLVRDTVELPTLVLDAGGPSLKGLLEALGAAFALGAPIQHAALFSDRFSRPLSLNWKPKFFANPCELAPVLEQETREQRGERREDEKPRVENKNLAEAKKLAPENGSQPAPLQLVRQLVSERSELPLNAILDEHRMLSDLHLNSITVSQLVSEAAGRLGLNRLVGLTDFANASVTEIARALEELNLAGGQKSTETRHHPAGVDGWVETFTVELVPSGVGVPPATHRALGRQPDAGKWHVFSTEAHPLAEALRRKLEQTPTNGVLVCLPEKPRESEINLLLDAARAVSATPRGRFIVVQYGWGGAAFARTLHLEMPELTTCVVNVPPGESKAVEWICAEAVSAIGYTEAHYDRSGQRREPRLKWTPLRGVRPSSGAAKNQGGTVSKSNEAAQTAAPADGRTKAQKPSYPISSNDVLLVTGGGKGIAAECALALGSATGAALALLGRADPAIDKELAANLARLAASNVRCCYVRADVTDPEAVRAAVLEAEHQLGPVTALLHGAGTNTPKLISSLDEAAFARTLGAKFAGVRNVLAALDQERLRLFVAFGSIIARAGLRGEADYATANEWLTALVEEFQIAHPQCHCLSLEWSVWSGVGMGERLGRIDSLIQQGITPISVEQGVQIFLDCLSAPDLKRAHPNIKRTPPSKRGKTVIPSPPKPVSLIITGRFGEPPTLKLDRHELPLRRFVEQVRVHYPGIELVVDAQLSVEQDPYLNDHIVQKQRLLPAVLGLEGMAQCAMALTESSLPPVFENVELARPITVPDRSSTTIRIAALRRGPDLVEVAVRSQETDYQVDHFRAFCRFNTESKTSSGNREPFENHGLLDCDGHFYGGILFHRGRFCRIAGYHLLKAKECIAQITSGSGSAWFGPYLPQELVLGDPAARDAALHAIQACVPHRRILPTGIDRMVVLTAQSAGTRGPAAERLVHAFERSRDGNSFLYDLEITDSDGLLLERWEGLHLRAVEVLPAPDAWPEPLISPYLERRLEELIAHPPVKIALRNGIAKTRLPLSRQERSALSDAAFQHLLGPGERVWRRPDGKPLCASGAAISSAHAEQFTLAVAGRGEVACDLEEVKARPQNLWQDLLGDERFTLAERVAVEKSEPLENAATRLWAAAECLRKSGAARQSPLVLDSVNEDGWIMLRSGTYVVATYVAPVNGNEHPLAFAVAVEAGIHERHSGFAEKGT